MAEWITPRGLEDALPLSAEQTAASFVTRARWSGSACWRSRPRGRTCTSPRVRAAAVQAWGMDAKARKQYRYHARAVERGQLRKYYRVRELAKELPELRRRIRRHAASREPTQACRRGGRRAARQRELLPHRQRAVSRGEPHLRHRHAAASATSRSRMAARRSPTSASGRSASDRSSPIARSRGSSRVTWTSPGARLFRYRDGRRWRDLTARDVNAYLQETLGVPFSAKDFRTWGGTLRAATVLAELGPARSETEARRNVATAMRLVAAELGNTPAICRTSYVHPIVVARYVDDGETIRLPSRYHATRGRVRAFARGARPHPLPRCALSRSGGAERAPNE